MGVPATDQAGVRRHPGTPQTDAESVDTGSPAEVPGSRLGRNIVTMLSRHGYWWLPGLTTLLVCAYRIDRPALWRDEMSTWWAVTRSSGDFVRLVRHVDTVHAAYYLLMRGWVAIVGDSVAALRAPSTFAMALAAALTAVLGRRLYDATTGLIAGALFAAVPATTWYGQEARPYALVVLAVVVATLLLVRALDEPTWARFGWYALAVAAVGLLNLLALAVLVGHLVGVLAALRTRRRAVLRWVPAVAVGLLPVVPVLLIGLKQQPTQLSWLPPPSAEVLRVTPGELFRSAAVAWIVMALAALAIRFNRRSAVLAGWALAGPLALLAASYTIMPLFLARYILYVVPAFCLLAAAAGRGLAVAPRLTVANRLLPVGSGLAVLVLVVCVGLPAHRAIRAVTAKQGNDYAAAFAPIRAEFRPGDGIVYAQGEWWMMLKQAAAYYLPTERRPAEVFARGSAERAGWWIPAECTDFRDCATNAPRIWVVRVDEDGFGNPLFGLQPAVAAVLHGDYTLARQYRSPGLSVTLLTRD